jgi:predicted protein tyrosine phosphatase
MKSLNDIKQDMSTLYDELRNGAIDLKTASELANVAGKFLKAEQLELATAIFVDGKANNQQLTYKQQNIVEHKQ